MQQQPSPKSLKVCAVFNGCFSMAFDKFVHFFSHSVNYTHTHTQFFCQRYWWELAVAMGVTFKRGCNPNLSGVRRGRH